VNFAGEAR